MNDTAKTGDYQASPDDEPAIDEVPAPLPTHIGRYRIEKVLGHGGFGIVYLAHDGQLQRLVAIKVPHRKLVDRPEAAEAYLTEARTVANLDHPNIVPVHDVGSTDDCPCYIVSKYIDGTDLATRIKQSHLSIHEAVDLVATVAETLHHAHKGNLVHRDIKPGNILLDRSGKPFVADFGLALREQDVGKGPRYAGTPAYMSPEQARGEGHRVDGRSDIFSLGVLFYELLVGRQPFRAESRAELMEQVTSFEARPPRQFDDQIPKELDRICLKALSKRASERYSTGQDMADDLRLFQAELTLGHESGPNAKGTGNRSAQGDVQPPSTLISSGQSGAASTTPTTPTSDRQPFEIVPKGLRSFDAHDADFFLELLPGPRDREGLPDSLRFWKTRVEETDPEQTFSLGLICGPSGCGKSSLVKAGLLPHLSDNVIAVYVEATALETETRLLNGLRKRFAALSDNMNLIAALASIPARGQGIPLGKKLVIVLDQLEQWLHAKKEQSNTDLVQALRQCDGGRVQCIVMVRDDFWMAVIRFMRELEIRLVEGQNSAAVDLFDADHARKVLAAFGRAFGKLPENPANLSKDQKEFLTQAVAGLAQEGKIICVRLALFAEMMKGKAWTPASLKAAGGTEGVGLTFLEETFSAATAPPEHRYHQKAARAVLKILLPEIGSNIKGHMRSHAELLEASGYSNRPKDFDDLLRILDNEVRLITPTDPEGVEDNVAAFARTRANLEPATNPHSGECGYNRFYQLTHDYLVQSIREWLTRKQKETRRGRAELLLADQAAVWSARPENRQLPSLLQWFQIRWFTAKKNWTPPQRKMMAKAGRVHALRGTVFGVLLVIAMATGLAVRERVVEQQKAAHASGLVQRILDADTTQVPGIIQEIAAYRKWADPLLREANEKMATKSRQKLHASLALLPVDRVQVDYLASRLLDAEPHEVPVLRNALAAHKDALLDRLWAALLTPEQGKEAQRLRAGAALAQYDPENEKWKKGSPIVVNDLVLENPVYLGQWSEMYRPVKNSLLDPLAVIFHDQQPEHTGERMLAANLLADYAADNPQRLADLLMDADDRQFAVIYAKFKEQGAEGLPILIGAIDTKLPPALPSSGPEREKLAKRQANAAVALLRMNQPEKVWPILKHSPDPRARSYLIHRSGPLGVEAGTFIKRLDNESDLTIRRALILSLGEYGEQQLAPDARNAFVPKLQEIYRTASDPGLHAASEWLLRRWKHESWLMKMNEAWAKVSRERQRPEHGATPIADAPGSPRWWVNTQGQTLVVIPGPVEFVMGSPVTEKGRFDSERQHKRRIGRTFALGAKSVTVEQFRQMFTRDSGSATSRHAGDLPAAGIDWYMAAAYCNWLSKVEGIPEEQWCYEISGEPGGVGPGNTLKLKEKFLSRTGYRLPTEAEMEYATRAGASTSRYYGETEELLPKYAWFNGNPQVKPQPGGSLKPNDLGLFDVQGYLFTWCQESFREYPAVNGDEAAVDQDNGGAVTPTVYRVLRGGSIIDQASIVRSAYRGNYVPTIQNLNIGFRLARTIIP